MSEEEDALEYILNMLDNTVDYMRDNLDELTKRRLDQEYPYLNSLDMLAAVYDEGITPGVDLLEDACIELTPYCQIQITEKPDSIPEIYLLFSSYWRETKRDYSAEEALTLLEQGVIFHPDNASLHFDLAKTYIAEIVEEEDWQEILIKAGKGLDYLQKTKEMDDSFDTDELIWLVRRKVIFSILLS